MDEVTRHDVNEWFTGMGTKFPAKRARAYQVLAAIFHSAVDGEVIEKTPCQIRGGGKSKTKRKAEILEREEVIALAQGMPPGIALAVPLAAFAALRIGEALGLQRGDIDLTRGVLHIRRTASMKVPGAPRVGTPKTEASSRDVAVPSFLIDMIKVHMAAYSATGHTAWLFPSPVHEGEPYSYVGFNEHFKRAAKEIGRPGLRTHDLRHAGALWAAHSGATVRELMARLGHTDPATAMVYQAATSARDRSIADRLGEGMEL